MGKRQKLRDVFTKPLFIDPNIKPNVNKPLAAPSLALEIERFALDLHSFVKVLDPSRIKSKMSKNLKDKFITLENELDRLRIEVNNKKNDLHLKFKNRKKDFPTINEKLENLKDLFNEYKSNQYNQKGNFIGSFRKKLEMAYQGLAVSLESYSLDLPKLRPTNYARSGFHVLSAIVSLFLIEFIPSAEYLIVFALMFAFSGWFMETAKRVSKSAYKSIMLFFSPVAHPHEYEKINSATWYSTALVLLSLTLNPMLMAIAVTVLGFADPAAGFIGRKYGKTKLWGGRSLEGSLTFTLVGMFVSVLVLYFFHPMDVFSTLIIGFSAGLFGALGELCGGKLDDNFTIPLTSAIGAYLPIWLIL